MTDRGLLWYPIRHKLARPKRIRTSCVLPSCRRRQAVTGIEKRRSHEPASIEPMAALSRITAVWITAAWIMVAAIRGPGRRCQPRRQVRVSQVRRVFHNGEHNAFTDLVPISRPVLSDISQLSGWTHGASHGLDHRAGSADGQQWEQVHRFQVAKRDTRDPHFLVFRDRLFVYTGTWYSGATTIPPADYDLNLHWVCRVDRRRPDVARAHHVGRHVRPLHLAGRDRRHASLSVWPPQIEFEVRAR